MNERPGMEPHPGGIILAYHRIAEVSPDPHGLCVSPERFAEHLEVLTARWTPTSLEAISGFPRGSLVTPDAVALTFDDGYADNLIQAKPALEDHGVPGAFFTALDYLEHPREFWWDEIERGLLESPSLPDTLELEIGGRAYRWELGDDVPSPRDEDEYWSWKIWNKSIPSGRHRAYLDLHAALRPLPPGEREAVLQELRARCGQSGVPPREAYRPLTIGELKALDHGPLTEVGAHSSTHSVLANLSPDAQVREIEGSKQGLEAILRRRVRLFAYPFGGKRDYTGQTVRLVQEAGFDAACAGFPGRLTIRTDPYQLPRFLVFNWDGDHFRQQLEKFFGDKSGRSLRRPWA